VVKTSQKLTDSNITYRKFADLYDLYVGEFHADFEFYTSYCKSPDKVIEIGCGTGRILDVLLQQDCIVTGVDISQEMLSKAKKKFDKWLSTGKLVLLNHDFSRDKLSELFDKALLTFYTFNYILDHPVEFLRHIRESLQDEGLLLMDLFFPNSLFDKSIEGKWIDKEFKHEEQLVRIRDCRTMEQDIEHRQQVFIVGEKEIYIDTRRKYYRPAHLQKLLDSAGFRNIEFTYGYDYRAFTRMIDETGLKNNYVVKAEK